MMSDQSEPAPALSGRETAPQLPAGIAGASRVFETAARIFFYLLIVLVPFRAHLVLQPVTIGTLYSGFTDVILHASDAAALLTLLMWTGSLAAARRRPATGPWLVTWPLLGILAGGLISAFGSVAPPISWYHVVRLFGLFLVYLYVLNEIRSLEDLRFPVAAMVAVQAAVGIAQYLSQHSIGLAFLAELVLDPARPGTSIIWSPGEFALRAYGLTDHPNLLGGVLALGLILLIAAYVRSSPGGRLPLFSVIALGAIALLVSFSRAAWLGLGAGCAVLLAWGLSRDRPAVRTWIGLGLSAGVLLLPFLFTAAPYLGARLGIGEDVRLTDPEYRSPEHRSLDERARLHEAANAIFIDRPLTGIGLGAFPVAFQERFPDFEYDYQPVHFVLLLAAAETGLVGALFYFLAITFPWVAAWLARRKASFGIDLAAASAALVGIAVIGLFDYYPWLLAPGRYWHWIIWGIWAGFFQARRQTHA